METTHETEKLDISDTVAEITNVISKHLTKVIEKVSNKNIDASQNMEILNQLPIVKNLKKENEALQKQFQELQEKYKKTRKKIWRPYWWWKRRQSRLQYHYGNRLYT